ncbi:MAG: hydroxyacid dehydrogenase [Saprospiraceae bacterium]|nr:hydroxyacid dehydrogenase [Saprospiraceae bacterium]
MTKLKILITDGVHPLLIEGLEQAGYHCDYYPQIKLTEVHQIIEPYTGIVINSKILMDKVLLDKATNLQFIGRLGSGLEIIDLAYAKHKGVAVYNSPKGNCDAVAEQAMGMLLALAIQLKAGDAAVRQRNWQREKHRGWELMGKTVGIIGFGHTGSALAKRLSGFGVKIMAYDKYKTNYTADYPYVQETSMQTIFEHADILSLHLPLTPETRGLVDWEYLQKFKKNIVLLNTSRGIVVKTQALINGLKLGKITGACLDVFENEKSKTYTSTEQELYTQLFQYSNLICAPHIAGWTHASKRRLAQIVLDKILGHSY